MGCSFHRYGRGADKRGPVLVRAEECTGHRTPPACAVPLSA
jgi:hypothetical protein